MLTPRYPALFEINTRVWLHELSRATGTPLTLREIPDGELDRLSGLGMDWIWLLGVWQTGPAGQQVSRNNPAWRHEFEQVLPDLSEEDICGSPFAVQNYTVHQDFGGGAALAHLRARLQDRGLRLLLDFVPNHTALDHPWVQTHPEYYIQGTEADLTRAPQNYCKLPSSSGTLILAHGRDPYFPGWPDTLQLNYRHAGLREARKKELVDIAEQCDGVRCDMAMLVLPDVIAQTWEEKSRPADGSVPVDTDFWPEAIAHVRQPHAQFLFMAEVYWDLEWRLQQQGFDYTYDKRLYDRLHAQVAEAVRGHLQADSDFQQKSVRFLENHDEPRAAAAFPTQVHVAAATVALLLPGLRFFHDGELEGRKVRLPVHLGRRPDEPVDATIRDYYRGLLSILRRAEVREGQWRLLECRPAWNGNSTWADFLAFCWEGEGGQRLLVVVNYGRSQGQCYVRLPFNGLRAKNWRLQDLMSPVKYDRDGDDLANRGLFLDMAAWAHQVFDMSPL